MRTLLKTLGITPGGGLDVLIRRASQVHRLRTRVGELEVSRTSLLYVAATIEPLVLTLFEANGLNFRTWEQSLGFQERPRFEYVEHPLDDLDFPVYRETTGAALEEFQSRWPKRPLDALGLTAAILIHESAGQAKRHLENAGLDLSTATKRFRQFVDASPDSSLVNPQAVPLPLSDLTNKILIAGRDVAMRHNIAFPGLTTSELFIGATGTEAPPPRAPAFLRTFIVNHATADRFEAYVNEWMAFYDRSEDSSHEIPFLTQPVAAILERARFIAEHAAKAEMISARHLVGALIASPRWAASSGVTDFLLGLQINLHVLAQAYYDYLSTAPVERRRDDLAIWRTFLGLREDSFLPRFNAEDVTGDDLLNVRDHVNAFATLIASKRIQPPLSVGLFGDWGSGKSFFMEKMRQKIAEHAARANARSDSVFHKRIVQINFNAWHYVEANLWASLVEHLFRNLKLTYEDDRDASINDRREELLRTLDSLMTERVEAEEKVQKAELARDRAAQELEAQKKAADASAALVTGMRATDVWELVNIETQIRTELQDQLNELGGGRILQSNEDVRKTVDELRTVGTRTNLLASWVTRQPRALVWLVVLIVLAPFGAQALIAIVKSTGPDWIKPLSEGVVQITTLVGAVVGWLAKRLKSGKAILDKLDNARSKVDARIAAAEEARQNKINDADDKLVAASNDVAASKQTVQTTEQAVLEAKQHLLALTTGYRLTRFIDERAASDDYRKLLGVLATVRQDFSKLSALMHEPPETSVVSDNARIDHIVLYIDDLDRCPPNVVVDVLQAVHLLLAFKLFVVVVGVDARWISESLEQKHRALRTKSQEEGGRAVFEESGLIGYEVKPHDYLEKIFQVPFWLDKLESKTTSRYIGNLLAEDVFRAATPAAPINVAAAAVRAAERQWQALHRMRLNLPRFWHEGVLNP